MASTAMAATAVLSSPAPAADLRPARHATSALVCVGLPALRRSAVVAAPTAALCRRIARNTISRSTGDAPAEVSTEVPEIVKTIQEAWDKLEDKYAVTTLAAAGFIALWVSTGMISAIDRLPIVPGILELTGIGYSGWFVYQNLVFKPDREALIAKIKSTISEIIESRAV